MANDYRQSLAQSLMVPTGGGMNPIAAFLRPIMGAGIARAQEKKEREARRSETTALGRLLSAAQQAKSKGEDPMQAITSLVEANPDEPGFANAGRVALERGLVGALTPQKQESPYTDVGKLNADLAAGRITQPQYEAAIERRKRPESTPSLTGRMRWIMATGRDPVTDREYSEEEQAAFARAMAPGSAQTREGFLRDWMMANARNFRTGPEVLEEGNKLYDSIQGVEPEVMPETAPGTAQAALPEAAATPSGPPVPRRKPSLEGVNIPLPPMELDAGIRERADAGTFTEEELIELQNKDPDQFDLLYEYLKGGK